MYCMVVIVNCTHVKDTKWKCPVCQNKSVMKSDFALTIPRLFRGNKIIKRTRMSCRVCKWNDDDGFFDMLEKKYGEFK